MVGENSIGIRLAWRSFHQVVGILQNLLLGRAPPGRFLLGGLSASVIHFAAIESHGRIVPAEAAMSIRNLAIKYRVGNPKGPGVPAPP